MKWLTVFDRLEAVHLNKDVGLLPKALAANKNIRRVVFLTAGKLKNIEALGKVECIFKNNILVYILFNARKFDVLHLFHLKWDSLFRAFVFKMLNPSGKVYLKLDADHRIKTQVTLKNNKLRKPRVSDLLYFISDHISVETKEIYDFLNEMNWDTKKLFLLPNGVDRSLLDFSNKKEAERLEPRQNKIITVGRLGSYQKNTESLIRAYKLLPANIRKVWALDLIGPIDAEAKLALENLSIISQDEDGEINFIGEVDTREKLYNLYSQAKIFAFPSRWEGASLALLEAFVFRLAIVATPVGMAAELIDINENGFLCDIDDDQSLSNAIELTIKLFVERNIISYKKIDEVCWDAIADKLLCRINGN